MTLTDLSPRERRRQRTEQAILDAARQIIREQGIDALSMRAIAEAIDYSPAGLYEYFGSKEEIVYAVIGQGFERFTRALQSVENSLPASEYMIEMGMAYIDFAVRNPDFFLLMFTTAPLTDIFEDQHKDSAGGPEADMLKEQLSFSVLYKGVERCVAEGIFTERPGYGTFEMALTSWAHVHGVAMLRVTNFRHIDVDFAPIDRAGLEALFDGMSR